MNEFTVIFLAVAITSIVVHWLLTRRHIQYVRKHRSTVPAAFVGKIPLAAHQKAADYTEAKVRLNLYELVIATVILLIWTIGGGLQLLDEAWRSQGFPLLWTGTAMLLSFFAISSLLGLPLSYYRTFKLEQRFGFNKSTLKIFFSDIFKNMMLGLLIGTPMIVLVIVSVIH